MEYHSYKMKHTCLLQNKLLIEYVRYIDTLAMLIDVRYILLIHVCLTSNICWLMIDTLMSYIWNINIISMD